ncbi:MAG: PKD domain-containing protein [Chitinophagales bacterium]|nr:PKD domain-containing protein [Chitinophagales bacterium]
MKKILLLALSFVMITTIFSQSTIIGTTTYDLQTNNSSKDRIIAYDDGTISALWTGSTDFGTWPDRGMFYNRYDGTAWGTYPTERIEDVRSGFGEILTVMDHEVVLSHRIVGADTTIGLFANEEIGGSTWTEFGGSGLVESFWQFSYCPEGTDDIYTITSGNVIPFSNYITALYFSRSDDGGESWSVLNDTIPFLTSADGIPTLGFNIGAESYQIRADGADVYILYGIPNSDLILLHSNDYGNPGTWERTNILDFPYDNFDGFIQSDIDGDFITDTLQTTDGYHEMIITDDGTVHVFSGYIRIYSDGFGSYSLNYRASGIWHWSTGMVSAELINTELDWESPDCVYSPYTGIGLYVYNYRNAALSSQPAASWDPATGRIYLLYTMKLEYTDIYGDPTNFSAESFRDIFGMYSDDDGLTWSRQNNLTNTAEDGEENFFLFVDDRVVDGKVHAIWQQDDEPGTSALEGEVVHENNVRYQAFEEDDFVAPLATSDFDYTVDLFYVPFTDMSTGATCYSWDFGDGGTSTLASPAHTYATGGSYTVCLTVSNSYGPVTLCQEVNLVTAPVSAFDFDGDPMVTFTDLSINTPTSWSWDFDDGSVSTEQNPVHTYVENGSYNVCLTSTNLGGSNTACQLVGINLATVAPDADFTYTAVGLNVTFTDMSTNTPTAWSWNFDDGSPISTEQNPSHTFPPGGVFNVCLQASNGGGIGTECKIIIILEDGVNELLSNTLNIYPNPANEFIIISSDADMSNVTFEVYDVLGKKVSADILVSSAHELQMNIENIAAGNYVLKIVTGSGNVMRTITIE